MAAEPCRFAADLGHKCVRSDGSPTGRNGVCFYEAAMQLRDSGVNDPPITDPKVYRLLASGIDAGADAAITNEPAA